MSDGDIATPGQHDADSEFRSTRTPRSRPGVAPWERQPNRRPEASPPPAQQPPQDESGSQTASSHITVADLIAKVTGKSEAEASRNHRAPSDPPTTIRPAVEYQRKSRPRAERTGARPARDRRPHADR
ncbi:MAG: hypothetical protein ACSLE6_11775, partial [Mycobacterium sp.]